MVDAISRRAFLASAVSITAASYLHGEYLSATMPSPIGSGWQNEGIENLTKSPHAKLHQVPIRAVTIKSGFWGRRRQVNIAKSIPTMHGLLEANGRMNNYRRLVAKSSAPQSGPVYSDSDVYKWTEAVGFALQSGDLPQLRQMSEEIIDEIVAVQQPDGYLNTYYVEDRASLRMLPQTQSTGHELYNIGHMLQGAIAYYRGTGERKLLDAGIRFVNDFLLPNYGPAPKKPIVSGHPEIEMALIELYRITADKRHLDLAGYILQGDARAPFPARRTIYMFSGTPFTARTKLEGHAVRAMYACCGAADYYMETGDADYWRTLNTLWNDMVSTKMYVSGGVGSRAEGEAFGDAYELPNFRAYGESCAAIGNMMWNWRMLSATGDAKFTDVMERALYNGINSGMSLDGTLYCYRNPLAFDASTGDKIRNPWYDTTCCPPNLERTLASLPGYFYSTSSEGLYVHLYDNSELDWHLEDGTPIKIAQKTSYPWDGIVDLSVSPSKPSLFTFYVRIPGWAENGQVSVNGKTMDGAAPGQYFSVRRMWSAGDTLRLSLDMRPQLLLANPRVAEDTGRVALQRGPLVYCMEEIDQLAGTHLPDVAIDSGHGSQPGFQTEFKPDVLDGVVVLRQDGIVFERSSTERPLYSRYEQRPQRTKQISLVFIPYYAWANRQPSAMQVWTPIFRG
jgi:DUF1680 family protein